MRCTTEFIGTGSPQRRPSYTIAFLSCLLTLLSSHSKKQLLLLRFVRYLSKSITNHKTTDRSDPLPLRVGVFLFYHIMLMTETIDGIKFKVTRLKTAHGSSALRWTGRIKGGSSRVRTHGGAAGSSSTSMSTKASALMDIR